MELRLGFIDQSSLMGLDFELYAFPPINRRPSIISSHWDERTRTSRLRLMRGRGRVNIISIGLPAARISLSSSTGLPSEPM
jgi:hypothetical protein